MEVFSTSQKYPLESSPFGTGGGGDVYKIIGIQNEIIKINKKCSSEDVQGLEVLIKIQKKLNFSSVVMPLELIYKDKGMDVPVGFSMKYIDVKYELIELRDKKIFKEIIKKNGKLYIYKIIYKLINIIAELHNNMEYEFIICDLKPQNILIDKSDNVYIIDADSLKIIEVGTGKIIKDSTYKSLDYEHPTTIKNSSLLSKKTDCFTLSIIIYELITGINPYNVMIDNGGSYDIECFKEKNYSIMFPANISPNQNPAHGINKIGEYTNSNFENIIKEILHDGSQRIDVIPSINILLEALKPNIILFSSDRDVNEVFNLDSRGKIKIFYRCENVNSLVVNKVSYAVDSVEQGAFQLDYNNTVDYQIDLTIYCKNGVQIEKTYNIQIGPPRLLAISDQDINTYIFKAYWSGCVKCYIKAENVSYATIDNNKYEVNKDISVKISKPKLATGKLTITLGRSSNPIDYEFKCEVLKPAWLIKSTSLYENSTKMISIVGKEEILTLNNEEFSMVKVNNIECKDHEYRFRVKGSGQIIVVEGNSIYSDEIYRTKTEVTCPPYVSLVDWLIPSKKIIKLFPLKPVRNVKLLNRVSTVKDTQLVEFNCAIDNLVNIAKPASKIASFFNTGSIFSYLSKLFKSKSNGN